MPLFFFDVHDDVDVADEDGSDLPDVEAARKEALRGARSLACEQVSKGYLNLTHRVEVRTEGRELLFSVTFEEAVTIKR